MGDDIILSAKGLTKEFRGFVAVGGVDLSIARGTIHALIGPNGAGKTTCFNLLTKFLQPTAGSIVYKGQDITRLAPAEITRLGLARSFQRSEEHTSELQSLMRISYAVFCLKKKKLKHKQTHTTIRQRYTIKQY